MCVENISPSRVIMVCCQYLANKCGGYITFFTSDEGAMHERIKYSINWLFADEISTGGTVLLLACRNVVVEKLVM